MELDEVKRELDLEIVKKDKLTSDHNSELSRMQRKVDDCNEVITRLNMDVQMMTDEVEVARDKGVKLAKAEASIEKYLQKLEEMANLKKQVTSINLRLILVSMSNDRLVFSVEQRAD